MEQYHHAKIHTISNDVNVRRSYSCGHNLHPRVTVLCTLSPMSFFLPIMFFKYLKIKEDNMYTISIKQ